jgi:hypothetical protein
VPVLTLYKREEKQLHCRLTNPGRPIAIPTLGENMLQCHFFFTSNSARPDLGLKPGGLGGKPETNRLSCIVGSRCHGAALRSTIFQIVTLRSSTSTGRRFGRTSRHHLQGERVSLEKREAGGKLGLLATCFYWFLGWLPLRP